MNLRIGKFCVSTRNKNIDLIKRLKISNCTNPKKTNKPFLQAVILKEKKYQKRH